MFVCLQTEQDWRHPVSGVNPLIIVVADLLVDSFHELTDMVKPSYVTKFQFEVRVEGFLIAVLPRTAFATVGWHRAVALEQ